MNETTVTVVGNAGRRPRRCTCTRPGSRRSPASGWPAPRAATTRAHGDWSTARTCGSRSAAGGTAALNAAESLRKGERVVVTGRLEVRRVDERSERRGAAHHASTSTRRRGRARPAPTARAASARSTRPVAASRPRRGPATSTPRRADADAAGRRDPLGDEGDGLDDDRRRQRGPAERDRLVPADGTRIATRRRHSTAAPSPVCARDGGSAGRRGAGAGRPQPIRSAPGRRT